MKGAQCDGTDQQFSQQSGVGEVAVLAILVALVTMVVKTVRKLAVVAVAVTVVAEQNLVVEVETSVRQDKMRVAQLGQLAQALMGGHIGLLNQATTTETSVEQKLTNKNYVYSRYRSTI